MTRKCYYINDETIEEIEKIAKIENRSINYIVREALMVYIFNYVHEEN